MPTQLKSPEKFRDEHLPVDPKMYKRIMLIGVTGSGKTTFLRKLLGTNPETERFPSTASNRTTTCNFESILTNEQIFKACITFLSKEQIEEKIKSCAYDACEEFAKTQNKEEAFKKLGEYHDQSFRLRFILGDSKSCDTRIENRYKKYIRAIEKVAHEYVKNKQELGFVDVAEKDDAEAILKEEITKNQPFRELEKILFQDVAETFGTALNKGKIYKHDGFPIGWTYETTLRKEFINTVSRFSSAQKKLWGTLVTPLVEGIRISGPFRPEWRKEALNLFITDGQGVGHTINKKESISCKSREMFINSDYIVIVDKADMSMPAETVDIISSVVECGCPNKIILAFTRFDQLSGDNFETTEDKKEHVNYSLRQAIEKVKTEQSNIMLSRDLESLPKERRLFLSNVDRVETSSDLQITIQQFFDIIYPAANKENAKQCNVITTHASAVNDCSKKKEKSIDFSSGTSKSIIAKHITSYDDKWRGLLGFGGPALDEPAHWSQIKALTKRMGYWGGEEYLYLRPISDFANCLQKAVYDCISGDSTISKEEKNKLLQKAVQDINEIAHTLIYTNHKARWMTAYDYRGTGSTIERRKKIDEILKNVKGIEQKKDIKKLSDIKADGRY